MNISELEKRNTNSGGATMVEFSLIVTTLVMSILFIFDAAHYLTVRAILNTGANRGLSLAEIINDLDADCRPLSGAARTQCGANRQVAINRILREAMDLPLASMLAEQLGGGRAYFIQGGYGAAPIEVVFTSDTPPGSGNSIGAFYNRAVPTTTSADASLAFGTGDAILPPGLPLRTVFQQTPIQVNLRARFQPILWFLPNLEVIGTAAGYREVGNASSLPPSVDCAGNIIPVGGPPPVANCVCVPPQVFNGTSCVCPPTQCTGGTVDTTGCTCNCPPNQQLENGTCRCPEPFVMQNGQCVACPGSSQNVGGICQCLGPVTCTNGIPTSACSCQCYSGFTDPSGSGNCTCPPPRVVVGSGADQRCVCPTIPCVGGFLNSNCACQCHSSAQTPDASGVCRCPNPPQCIGGTITSSCSCRCPNGFRLDNGVCVQCPNICTGGNFIRNTCSCNCSGINCNGGTVDSDCGCTCPSNVNCNGGTLNSSNCSCSCPSSLNCHGGTVTANCTCNCGPASCIGGTLSSNCICSCPDGTPPVNGICNIHE